MGGAGANTLRGGSGDDSLWAGGGADVIAGGPGADFLSGGTGASRLSGGAGDDRLGLGPRGDARCGAGRDELAVSYRAPAGPLVSRSCEAFESELVRVERWSLGGGRLSLRLRLGVGFRLGGSCTLAVRTSRERIRLSPMRRADRRHVRLRAPRRGHVALLLHPIDRCGGYGRPAMFRLDARTT